MDERIAQETHSSNAKKEQKSLQLSKNNPHVFLPLKRRTYSLQFVYLLLFKKNYLNSSCPSLRPAAAVLAAGSTCAGATAAVWDTQRWQQCRPVFER